MVCSHLVTFLLLLLCLWRKLARVKEKWKLWWGGGGGGGGGDFGKRAFPQPSCTLIISRSELNPDLTVIRLYFSNLDVDQTNVADDPGEYSDDFDELDDEEYSDESDEGSNGDSPKKPVSAAKMKDNGEDEEAEVEYPDDFEDDSEEEVRYCN